MVKVGKDFVSKVMREIEVHGKVVDPNIEEVRNSRKRGVGVISLEEEDDKLLKIIQKENPQTTLGAYQEEL